MEQLFRGVRRLAAAFYDEESQRDRSDREEQPEDRQTEIVSLAAVRRGSENSRSLVARKRRRQIAAVHEIPACGLNSTARVQKRRQAAALQRHRAVGASFVEFELTIRKRSA
jgi:hypothetical protein